MVDFSGFPGGWVDDPEAVGVVASGLPFPVFGDTEAGQIEAGDLPDHAFLWEAARLVTGGLIPPRNQGKVGSCVAFGTARAIEYSMLAEIAGGEKEEFKALATEVIYGGSRVEIGGGKLGRGDGSIGAWAAKWVHQWGLVARGVYGKIDLKTYSEARCKEYGSGGVPAELEAVAKTFPVQTITQVKTWEDAKKALAQGYGIAICSGVGFSMARDSNGISKASGSWGHCMCLAGYVTIEGAEYGRIDNSWGDMAHHGPTGPGNPGPEGFYTAAPTIGKMLSSGDSWAFSSVQGFPLKTPEKLDWLI
ncbi:Peptidase C1A, papain C-terminal [uncultured Caudovirales phage]|uniref:Peptidase C1A, papain C-terminal n=1 Tax=uncultured Caudovirales phage TaxID=2100421 RepID=A0A6J5QSZ3_9CAUD|nr:Peptidase C1A, papain C-terminal [uncultured Caudovirales phage]CAB4164265.1 Peptidase C1A, papain C-terminal [uncultured Caudovirales phage]CAB4177710.1 Peptidase C1A, papain C-terminal [uncultured Caudovirales phage]CAB4187710.1 Peptidase C1A, papain C-terminal [uncultured Caudovirales phage]